MRRYLDRPPSQDRPTLLGRLVGEVKRRVGSTAEGPDGWKIADNQADYTEM